MPTSPVCVDASVVVRLVAGDVGAAAIARTWSDWITSGRRVVAPTLLFYEVCNALHRYRALGQLDSAQVAKALDAALTLDIELLGDEGLHRRAVALAEEAGLPSTYDAHYVALALALDGDLWTTDQRLASYLATITDRVFEVALGG